MKILLVKTTAEYTDVTKSNSYNYQEIGLAKALNRAGHQCDVVYYGGRCPHKLNIAYNSKGDTFVLYYVRAWNILRDSIFIGLEKIIRNYDIIHSGGYDKIQSWLFAKICPKKLIIYNGTYFSEFNKTYNKKCVLIDKIFVPTYVKNNVTFDTKNRLSEIFLRNKGLKDVTSIGVGIDLEIIDKQAEDNHDFIQKIKVLQREGKRILLYIGKIEPRRNILFLLDIVNEVSKSENVVLVIIGKSSHNEYGQFVENKMADMGKLVVYIPFLDQKFLRAIYKLSDIFLLPTLYEIFGMVLLEAMYYKLPIVSTLNGGSDLLIKNKHNGFIVDNYNLDLWVSTIKNILMDNKKAKLIGQNAHETIINNFTWDALAKKFITLFEKKIASNEN